MTIPRRRECSWKSARREGPSGTTWRLCLFVDGKAMNLDDLVATTGPGGGRSSYFPSFISASSASTASSICLSRTPMYRITPFASST